MAIQKKHLSLTFRAILFCVFLYFISSEIYYYSFNGNKNIKFINADTASVKTFGDILKANMFKGKITYVDLFFNVKNNDYTDDLPYLKKLSEKYNNKPFQILYTNDGSPGFLDDIDQKRTIKQDDLFGYHMTVPYGLEMTLEVWKNERTLVIPKYMLVKDNIIIDTFATPPSNYDKLCKEIDSLLTE